MATLERTQVVNSLKKNVCKVTFRKADGSTREMTCTLKEEHLPPSNDITLREEYVPRWENPDVVQVWDLDKEAWRSFRLDSVESFGLA